MKDEHRIIKPKHKLIILFDELHVFSNRRISVYKRMPGAVAISLISILIGILANFAVDTLLGPSLLNVLDEYTVIAIVILTIAVSLSSLFFLLIGLYRKRAAEQEVLIEQIHKKEHLLFEIASKNFERIVGRTVREQ